MISRLCKVSRPPEFAVSFYKSNENILQYLGFTARYCIESSIISDIHPGISASISVDKQQVGYLGKVHPNVVKDDIYVAEINLTSLMEKKIRSIKYKEVSKYPEVNKDLAFVVKKDVNAKDLMNEIRKAGGRILTNIDVFDVYVGENVSDDEKSIAFSLTFSDQTKTLNDEEISNIMNRIIEKVEKKLKAKLRDK